MYGELFISHFAALGKEIEDSLSNKGGGEILKKAIESAYEKNTLFTPFMQRYSLSSICNHYLQESSLREWIGEYHSQIYEVDSKVLIVMAGNLPLVGFHDLLSTLAVGKRALIKLSSNDNVLLPAIMEMLFSISPYWRQRVHFTEEIPNNALELIVTGSDHTAAFFESRFAEAHRLIRGTKSSIAILSGEEDESQFAELSKDLFLYFGMGCRSVSTLLVPIGYDLNFLALKLKSGSAILEGSLNYHNAYRYQKALAVMKRERFVDGENFIIKINSGFPPPMSVVGVVEYSSPDWINNFLIENEERLQCVVNYLFKEESISFGKTQEPRLSDYADGINSLAFLLKKSNFALNT